MSTVSDDGVSGLAGVHVAFVGKLGGVTRREATRLVRDYGGVPVEMGDPVIDLVVIGADELPLGDEEELLDSATRQLAADGKLEIVSETQFWQRLGLVDAEQNIRRLYTPAMLAELLGVSLATVRRWHRRKLIVPAREVHQLPYFDFQEIASARRLAELLAAGASPAAIEKKLSALLRFYPDVDRPLAQLAVIVEGQHLLLRQGEGLIEPGGQMRIDFEAIEATDRGEPGSDAVEEPFTLSWAQAIERRELKTPDEILDYAGQLEDEGNLEAAADMCRAALAAGGPRAEVCFQLAELLYRVGDITAARERYYMALELNEDYVEARANLGCVLAETGQLELAVAAFQGTLEYHPDYPDVHFHLARTLDELSRRDESLVHWATFLSLAPDNPWADEARRRLGESRRGT